MICNSPARLADSVPNTIDSTPSPPGSSMSEEFPPPQSPLRPPCLHLWMTPSGAAHDLRLQPPSAVPLRPQREPISRLTDSPTCPLLVAPGPSRSSSPPEGQVSAVSAWVNVLPRAKPSGHTPAGNGTADHTPHIPSPDEGRRRRAKASRKTEDPVRPADQRQANHWKSSGPPSPRKKEKKNL